MTDLADAVRRKARESATVIETFFAEHAPAVETCAVAMAGAFTRGARLFVFGNGGSACDAQHIAVEFMHPIFETRPALPAIALPSDVALMSALGNDTDFALGFAHQLAMLARSGDIALGISTSGKSANVVRAMRAAREAGLMTIAFAGKDGGKLATACDHTFVVPSYSIHRIQEVHTTLLHVLWDLVHLARGEQDIL